MRRPYRLRTLIGRHLFDLFAHEADDLRAHIAQVDERAAAREQMNANNIADLTLEVRRLAKIIAGVEPDAR